MSKFKKVIAVTTVAENDSCSNQEVFINEIECSRESTVELVLILWRGF